MYETLIEEYEGGFGKGRTVEDIVDCVEELPPMPDVITRALCLAEEPNASPDDLAEVMMRDPILTTSILRTANSVEMAQQQEVTSLSDAVLQIGMGRVKSILFASALRGLNHKFGPLERLVWEKSLGAASAAHVICEQLRKRYRDELYLTSLLHNLGQVVFLFHKEIADMYPAVLDRIRASNEDFATAEREVIGFSHPLVGALVARKWNLPISTCTNILHYADPFEGVFKDTDEKLITLRLSTIFGLAAGFGCPEGFQSKIEEVDVLMPAVGYNLSNSKVDYFKETRQATQNRFAAEASAYGQRETHAQAA